MPLYVTNVKDDYADIAERGVKMLVVGPPGAGKTLFASTWPNPAYADVEGRLLSIRNRAGIKRVRIGSIAELDQFHNMLDQTPEIRAQTFGGPVDTVVIDTIDEVARIMQRERLRGEKREILSMGDWSWFGDNLRDHCRAFRNLDGLNVIFNCHLKPSEDSETGKIVYRPDIQGSVGNEIASYVDIAVLLEARTHVDPASGDRISTRVLQTIPDSAHDWVKDQSGSLPAEISLNFVDDGARILQMIFGEAPPQARPPLVVETSPAPEPTPAPVEAAPVKKAAKRKPEPERVEVVPEKGTEPEPQPEPPSAMPPGKFCAVCGDPIEDRTVAEISEIRFGEPLCRADFGEARKRQQSVTK